MTISPEVLRWVREEPLPRYMSLCGDRLACGRSIGETRTELLASPLIKGLIRDVAAEPWPPINSHRAAGHPLHKLSFLAEIGLDEEDLGLSDKLDRIAATAEEGGMLELPMRAVQKPGKDGSGDTSWALCDSPLLAYSLMKLGRGRDPPVAKATRNLIEMGSPNGYRCVTAPEVGFRGPGRKDDPCLYANLIMLKLMSLADPGNAMADRAAESIMDTWANSRTKHPYMFYMGTDFRKLKYPLVWFDILHVAEVLSRFERFRRDDRLKEMVDVINSQAGPDGRFTPGSVWQAWKDWDFGQKKVPSRTLTVAAYRVLSRMSESLDCAALES